MTAVLHSYFRSSTSTRVRVALNLKGVGYDYVAWNIRNKAQQVAEYLALNPHGLVPALEMDGDKLFQSLAIIEYLDERIPEPPLLPAAPVDRARVRALSYMIACEVHPLNNLRVLRHIASTFGADDAAQAAWFRHWVHETFVALETRLNGDSQTGTFCHGETPSLADICLYAQVLNNRRFSISPDSYPTITRIYEACVAHPAFAKAAPEHQPDAF